MLIYVVGFAIEVLCCLVIIAAIFGFLSGSLAAAAIIVEAVAFARSRRAGRRKESLRSVIFGIVGFVLPIVALVVAEILAASFG